MLVFLLAVAAAPRKAKPAVPAKPAGRAEGALAGRVILVDAGHGGRDGGARARDSGTWEKEINLQTALALRDALEETGARVILTRDADRQYSDNKREDLTARLGLARENGAEMVISIHMNEYRSRRESGPQVFYRAGQEESRLLAGALQSSLIRALAPKKGARGHGGGLLHPVAGRALRAGGVRLSQQSGGGKAAADGVLPPQDRGGDPGRDHRIFQPCKLKKARFQAFQNQYGKRTEDHKPCS